VRIGPPQPTVSAHPRSGPAPVRSEIATHRDPLAYVYQDRFGVPLYRKLRCDDPKRFVWEVKVGDGWRPGLNETPRVLYRLPELISSPAKRVWIPEGEKDVESLLEIGFTATTSGGVSDPWAPEFNGFLAGLDVVILTDVDGAGWERGNKLAAELFPVAKTVKVVSFAGMELPDHSDVSDWLALGHTAKELEVLADATPVIEGIREEQLLDVESKGSVTEIEDRLTEAGAAERFARLHANDVRFDHRCGQWLMWEGHRWRRDTDAAITRLALDFARAWQREALVIEDLAKREAALKAALRLEKREALTSMLTLAHDLKPIADSGESWDPDPYLLGVPNGIVDLRTGALRPGRRQDKITLNTSVPYNPEARSRLWEDTLRAILLDDEQIDFFQAAVGYSVTGDTSLDRWFLVSGKGGNGKGTLAHPIRHALGEYALELPASVFDLKVDRAPYELARLPGRRFVTSSESGDTIDLNHDRIKQLTGGDRMSAANKYQQPFEFLPVSKLWFFCNRKPRVTDDTVAFWRRVLLLPFTVSFVGREDATLRPLLTQDPSHQAAVLTWIINGSVRYLSDGLGTPPESVLAATKDYRKDQDILGPFLEQACALDDSKAEIGAGELYEIYGRWADRQHLTTKERLTATKFGRTVSERFKHRNHPSTRVKIYIGISQRGLL
jgi:putative DNA primase/helicase